MNIGKAIMTTRKEAGIKRSELALSVGISATALYNIENDLSFPTKETIKKICIGLGVSVAYLLISSVTEDDIPREKRQVFRALFPTMISMMKED